MKVSVVIPTFNEEKVIGNCLNSLDKQNYKDLEIIVVDDGSADKTLEVLSKFKILKQDHLGAGAARNLGSKNANGEILVFVDADMEFDPEFITKLVEPIVTGKVIGTFSKEEYVLNKENIWSRCWNVNRNLPQGRMHPPDYPDHQPVFRAILKKEFDKVGGFSTIGYIDDHTLSEKLGLEAVVAPGAVFYHRNPDNLPEIYRQARWIGKSEFKRRKIKNENLMRFVALARYSLPLSLMNGLYKSFRHLLPHFLVFKLVYDFGVEVSVIKSFCGEQKYR